MTTTPCFCQSFEFGEFDGENEAAVSYDTDCSQSTTRVFAQGHDAKLAGYLVRAEMAGEEIRMVEGGMAISFPDAVAAAAKVSEAFAAKVRAMRDAAGRRVAKKILANIIKAARKSAKAAKQAEAAEAEAAEVPTKREATIKIGRWTYDATIDPNGMALYNTKKGEAKSAKPGEYSEV